jgi:hypothetical protein
MKGMKMHMVSHIKVHSSTTYHILLARSGELPNELNALKLTMGFQQRLAHLAPSWLVNKATSLSQHLTKQGLSTWHKSTPIVSISLGSQREPKPHKT